MTGPLIDFMLVDIWIPMALPALELVTPRLRPGALVVCDNVVASPTQYAAYLDYVRDPSGAFTSVTVPGDGGLEMPTSGVRAGARCEARFLPAVSALV